MIETIGTVGGEFHREIVESGRLAAFLLFVAMVGTFGFIRLSTHMIHAQVSWWPGNVSVGGTHVHHLVWGIFAMMIFGYIGVAHQPESPWREIVAVFFGIGVGLTLDEFALWLELKDVYWEKDGRKSVDAMIVAAGLAGMAMIGLSVWARLADDVKDGVVAAVGLVGVLGVLLALVNAAKEKPGWALASLLVPVTGIVPAFRLAKPHSLWARLFYRRRKLIRHGDRRLERSRARYPAGEGAGSAEESSPPSPEPSSASTSGSATAGQSSS
jgi:lysyl-tRNA synthetase class 2